MQRSVLARLLISAVGLLASLSTPGYALSHGYAHGELAEHSAPATLHASVTAVVSAAEDNSEHPDRTMQTGVTTRSNALSPAVISVIVSIPLEPSESSNEWTRALRAQVAPSSAESPPSSPRAPPTGL
ncbi:MAG: hypothetical protein ACYC3F_09440 [Gemmatimonadaceae bacterium]